MSVQRSSAPGKVVLSGEYAVLDGAPAVSMAVDRRAVVTVEAGGRLSVRCEGLGGQTDTRLLECIRRLLPPDSVQGNVVLDTRAFVDTGSGVKFGIGSSAALSVALLRAWANDDISQQQLADLARQAHGDFQNGFGSGVDVATSVLGGLVEYNIGAAPRRIAWPAGLFFTLLWSGTPSSTVDKLGRLAASGAAASRTALRDASIRIAASWSDADAAALLREYRNYVRSLRQFDLDHDIGIFDAGHDALVRKAESEDVVYKPCGAGGGDIGVVLGVDHQAVRGFAARAASHGFRQLDMEMDPVGVELKRAGA